MSDALQLATPERVAVDLPIAGLGSRAMAYGVDVGLLGSVGTVLYFGVTFWVPDAANRVLELSGLARTLGAVGVFFGLWVYWTLLEVAWNGQTVGKRLLRIRVVRSDGSAVTVFASAVRNLLRLVDFLPACYPVGLVTMLIDKRHRRLGDLLAGTVLVRDEEVDLSRYEQATGAIDVNLLEVATGYLARFDQLEPAAQARVGELLARRLGLEVPAGSGGEVYRDAVRAHVSHESPR